MARAAIAVGADVTMVAHEDGSLGIPSIVAVPPAAAGGGPPLVGALAEAGMARHPERTIGAVKRLMGRRLDAPEVRHHRQATPYDLVGPRNGDPPVRVRRRPHPPQALPASRTQPPPARAQRPARPPSTRAGARLPATLHASQGQARRRDDPEVQP